MGIRTERPEEEKEQQFTFTPHATTPPPTPPPVHEMPVVTPTPDWRELRRQERAARRAERRTEREAHGYNWIGGVVLILLGGLFLLQNTGLIEEFENWWALFILIPALGSLSNAWHQYQEAGQRWTPASTGSVMGGLLLCAITAMFLFGWNIGLWWPLFLIAGGIAVLLGALPWRSQS